MDEHKTRVNGAMIAELTDKAVILAGEVVEVRRVKREQGSECGFLLRIASRHYRSKALPSFSVQQMT